MTLVKLIESYVKEHRYKVYDITPITVNGIGLVTSWIELYIDPDHFHAINVGEAGVEILMSSAKLWQRVAIAYADPEFKTKFCGAINQR